ncbi:agmatinase [Streptomyces cinnamoneus]|uniref:Agmatinase n=1 Tax=Streptomyces cinnamoneus TaxID=53446 RepID=A0A2G1XN31_STRCJ|nr:agmatinase family protein [Streptomyces cinnamoneus]PHQ52664.1 agmatinase [Streptomyces cinnamoneus]PPT12098.1 agmatinase [Streptomyces cinnamoneus]
MSDTPESENWRREVDRSFSPRREAGPIDLRRYYVQPAYSGMPTFMGVPLALNQDDLRAGKVDAAVVGCPVDVSTGHRGAAYGPRAIRSDERYMYATPEAYIHSATRVNPFNVLKVVDYGDAAVDPFDITRSMEPIRGLVREIAEVGAAPIVLGGDHSLLWPSVGALSEVHGRGSIAVVHFDAHPDCHDELFGHKATHTTPIRRLMHDEMVPGANIIQVGLRTATGPDDQLFNWMRRAGMKSHFMAEIERVGLAAVVDKVIEEAKAVADHVYISLDIDVLDPAFAPGTGTPEPAGLNTRELFTALRRIAHETNLVGMDVVEVAPHLDPGYSTAMNARRAVFEVLTGLAMNKVKISTKNYTNPIVAGEVRFSLS